MIKIIAGKFKNRKLKYFNLPNVRPTQARVRKSIMDSLNCFNNKNILDLFSGIGTLGIESLSRGAESVVFVDNNSKVLSVLKKNLDLLNINDCSKIIKSDALKYLEYVDKKFDIIFADPPYGEFEFFDLFPLIENKLSKNGIFCYESKKTKLNFDFDVRVKSFGHTQVIFWRNE